MKTRRGNVCDAHATIRSSSTLRLLAVPLYMGMCVQLVACNPAMRNPTLHVIPRPDWISALGPFSEATVRVNNYSPTAIPGQPPVSAFHLANDSRISLPNGTSVPFNIPVVRQNPYSVYINDLNSTAIDIDARGGTATVSVAFEEDDYEIIANCVDNVACGCGDPRIDLNAAELRAALRVGAAGGRLVITEITTDFRSTFEETGPCRDHICAIGCDIFAPNRESRAREAIQNAAARFFNTNQALLETLLNARVRELGVDRPITSAVIGGRGELILTLAPE